MEKIQTANTNSDIQDNYSNNNNNLFQKIDDITVYQRPYIRTILYKFAKNNLDNTNSVCNYIINEQNEFNIKESTKEGKIKVLIWLSNYFQDLIDFKNMTKQDIISYLHKSKRPISEDPKQSWI